MDSRSFCSGLGRPVLGLGLCNGLPSACKIGLCNGPVEDRIDDTRERQSPWRVLLFFGRDLRPAKLHHSQQKTNHNNQFDIKPAETKTQCDVSCQRRIVVTPHQTKDSGPFRTSFAPNATLSHAAKRLTGRRENSGPEQRHGKTSDGHEEWQSDSDVVLMVRWVTSGLAWSGTELWASAQMEDGNSRQWTGTITPVNWNSGGDPGSQATCMGQVRYMDCAS
jgi:hypothetical protein